MLFRKRLETPESNIEEAHRLFGELPIEIQDPVSRGGPEVAWASPICEEPSFLDIMNLSEENLEKYNRTILLTNEWVSTPEPKPKFPRKAGRNFERFVIGAIEEYKRAPNRT